MMVGLLDMKGDDSIRRVYDEEGLCPTLTTMGGGHREPKVLVRACLTPDRTTKRQNGRRMKEDGEPMFTLTAQDLHGVVISYGEVKIRTDELSTTLDANYHKGLDNHGARTGIMESEPGAIIIDDTQGFEKKPRVYTDTAPTLRSERSGLKVLLSEKPNWIPGPDNINRTLRTGGKGSLDEKHNYEHLHDGVRIRKLTELECWRLQGFPDWAHQRAVDAGVSKTQRYKQAGNSVTVPVIQAIAGNLL